MTGGFPVENQDLKVYYGSTEMALRKVELILFLGMKMWFKSLYYQKNDELYDRQTILWR